MKSIQIRLNELQKINDFVSKACKVDGDIVVKSGRYTVNGKSTLGMCSLALHLGATVMFPDDAKEFEDFVKTLQI